MFFIAMMMVVKPELPLAVFVTPRGGSEARSKRADLVADRWDEKHAPTIRRSYFRKPPLLSIKLEPVYSAF